MKAFLILLVFIAGNLHAQQEYPSLNVRLAGHIAPMSPTVQGNRYSACWGWYQADKQKEYFISGASNGTYFIDITVPSSPSVSAFVPGKENCIWREMKTYKNYCYIISDDPFPNKFQIVDMQYLPDSVKVVYEGNDYFERGHTIWIDNEYMYIASTTFSTNTYKPMTVWSLATPQTPVLRRSLDQDVPNSLAAAIHDMYVRNDTIYASAAWQGLYVIRRTGPRDSLVVLGSYVGYPAAGYNHSSYLTRNGKYMMFCDEVPASLPIHFINVENPENIQPIVHFRPATFTTGHNPYIIGDEWAVVSCYKDGLYLYDISEPMNVRLAGYFDTYPQGGVNTGDYGSSAYNGNWGAYPFFPSGMIGVNDITNGIFILDPHDAFTIPSTNPVSIAESAGVSGISYFPNPANDHVAIRCETAGSAHVKIINIMGQAVLEYDAAPGAVKKIDTSMLPPGTYAIEMVSGSETVARKLVIQH